MPPYRQAAWLPIAFVLIPAVAGAQVLITGFNVPSNYRAPIGQSALNAKLTFSINDNQSIVALTYQGLVGPSGVTLWPDCRAVENSNGNLFWFSYDYFNGMDHTVSRLGGSTVTFASGCKVQHMVPLTSGRILVKIGCSDPAADFRIYDGNLALVSTFAGLPGTTSVPGMTRRPDGTIVACANTTSGPRLTAYTEAGTILWDQSIGTAGSIGSDSEGNVYLLASSTLIKVYDNHGAFHHDWGGPPGQALDLVKEIASSSDGSMLFALRNAVNPSVKVYGQMPTAARPASWGRLKTIYRD